VKVIKSTLGFLVPSFAFSAVAMAAEGAEPAEMAGTPWSWWVAPVAALLALGFAYYFYKKVMSAPEGNEKMISIANHVREGAYAYLFRQYSVVSLVFLILLVIFAICARYALIWVFKTRLFRWHF